MHLIEGGRNEAKRGITSIQLPICVNFDEIPKLFSNIDKTERNFHTRDLLGGKGDGLVEMKNKGLNVPDGFVLTTEFWRSINDKENNKFDNELEIQNQLQGLELSLGKHLNDENNPLILSVRSSPVDSMPGAMTTITNVGINDNTLRGLSERIGHTSALQAYFQLITEIGRGYGIPENEFNNLIDSQKDVGELNETGLQPLVEKAKELFYEKTGFQFPQDPKEQLAEAIKAVFDSYDSPQSEKIRKKNGLEYAFGTACVIQHMVFGNVSEGGSGVLITPRDKDTFEDKSSIYYRPNSQGQNIVGNNTNKKVPINKLPLNMQEQMMKVIAYFEETSSNIPQEVEFVYDGKELWVLQKRTIPLSVLARARQIISSPIPLSEAAKMLTLSDLEFLLEPRLDPNAVKQAIKNGQLVGTFDGARISPGIAYGKICRDPNKTNDYGIVYIGPLNLDNINDLPADRLTAILTSLGSPASHIARHAEKLGSIGHIPIIFAIPPEILDNLSDGTEVTIDASTNVVKIYKGTVDKAKEKNAYGLSSTELRVLKDILKISRENEWRNLTTDEQKFFKYKEIATEARQKAKLLFRSEKAIQEYVKNALLPSEICESYSIAKPNDINNIKALLLAGINQGNDVSIRTCHEPELPGKNPYRIFTNVQEVRSFFADNSYYDLIAPISGHQVTEVLVGSFPKGKLEEEQKNLHAAWTISVKDNIISLVVNPHTPTLRNLGNASLKETFLYSIRPITALPHNSPIVTSERIPEKYKDDPVAKALSEQIKNTVFDWIEKCDLSARLAGLTSAFPHPYYSTPSLEGQARVGGKEGKEWTLVYGTNIDKLNNGDKNIPK